jgi:hypothetical protein
MSKVEPYERELIVEELASLGGGSGGGLGARLTTRWFRPNEYECSEVRAEAPDAALASAADKMRMLGRLVRCEGSTAVAVIGAGSGNLNPAVVTVTTSPEAGGCEIHFRGVATEGLIKQRAGRKAVVRLQAALPHSSG